MPLVAVVRKTERVRLPERAGSRQITYRFESLDYPATERRFNGGRVCHAIVVTTG